MGPSAPLMRARPRGRLPRSWTDEGVDRWSMFRTRSSVASMLAIVSPGGRRLRQRRRRTRRRRRREQAAAAPAMVEVMLSDFAIDPSAIEVPSGQPLTFSIMNHGQTPHTFGVMVDGQTLESRADRGRGHRHLDVPALEAGTYDALCTVPGHKDLGMVATVVRQRRRRHDRRRRFDGRHGFGRGHSSMSAVGDGGAARGRRERLPRGRADRHHGRDLDRAPHRQGRQGLRHDDGAGRLGDLQGRHEAGDGVQRHRAGARGPRAAGRPRSVRVPEPARPAHHACTSMG